MSIAQTLVFSPDLWWNRSLDTGIRLLLVIVIMYILTFSCNLNSISSPSFIRDVRVQDLSETKKLCTKTCSPIEVNDNHPSFS